MLADELAAYVEENVADAGVVASVAEVAAAAVVADVVAGSVDKRMASTAEHLKQFAVVVDEFAEMKANLKQDNCECEEKALT